MPDLMCRPKRPTLEEIGLPSLEQLRSCFKLDPKRGILFWRDQPYWRASQRIKHTGRPAGMRAQSGYIKIQWCRRHFYAHRIIWKMATGHDPIQKIDHINGIRHDNRIANLREATHAQNCMNKSANKGRTLPKGVFLSRGRFTARIGIGTYDTFEEASAAYDRVARLLFGEFARSK